MGRHGGHGGHHHSHHGGGRGGDGTFAFTGCCMDQADTMKHTQFQAHMEGKLDALRSLKYSMNPASYKDESLVHEFYMTDRVIASLVAEAGVGERQSSTIGCCMIIPVRQCR